MSPAIRGMALRLHGPLQSWGGSSVGDDRPTLAFPTRSGVLGLVAACMGIRRHDVERLAALSNGTRVHVRVDACGTPLVDDQTIQGNPNASPTRQTIQSKRTYLCDASFVAVVVPGPGVALEMMATSVRCPVFAPYLGRRSCVPSTPLLLRDVVEGGEVLDLFRNLERGPTEALAHHDRWAAPDAPTYEDFYLDVADHPQALRRIPVRDDFRGPLPRQWRERVAVHVRVPMRRPVHSAS